MRSLKLNDIAVSLGVRIYCNGCGAWYDPKTESSKVRQNKCSHPPNKQRYKSTIVLPSNGAKRKRKSLVFNTRDLQEVILLGLEFKKNVKIRSIEKVVKKANSKPQLLLDCFAMFLDFKNDIGVEEHLKKNISRSAISEFKNHILKWKKASDSIGDNFCQLKVDNVSSKNVATLIKFLSTFSNSSQKKAFGFYNQFYRFLNENGYNVVSPFKGIQVSDGLINEPRAVTQEEFNKILQQFNTGSNEDKVRDRSVYFDWLAEALNLAALTGRRREEFMLAKFSDIHLVNGKLCGGYIKMIDSKYSRQNKHKIGATVRYTKSPIYSELCEFILQMGYEKYKDTDRFIVAGDETKQRNTLADNLTNAFAFYRNKLGISEKVQLKGLRKHYITRMRNEFGDNANFFTGHSDGRIDKKHYYDDRELFKNVKDFKLWQV
jgi:integrase